MARAAEQSLSSSPLVEGKAKLLSLSFQMPKGALWLADIFGRKEKELEDPMTTESR